MSGDRLVNIVVSYGTKMFGKPVREASASLIDAGYAGYAINDVRGGACEIMSNNKIKFGSGNDGRYPRKARVTAGVTAKKVLAGNNEFCLRVLNTE